MAKAFINDENLTDIADAIRATLDESRQYLPSEMADAIESIPVMAQLNRKKYFRPVPAGAASGYATIEQIEGNTVKFNQLVDTGIYANVLPYSSAVTEVSVNSDNEIEVKTIATAGASYSRGFKTSPFSSLSNIVGHKYLLLCESKSSAQYSYSSDSALMGVTSPFTIVDYTANRWCTTGTIITAVNTNNSFILRVSEQPSVGSYFYFRNFQLFDLTRIFGAGNEPTTVADFEAWMAQNIGTLPYYDYNAGELLSVKMSGMQTQDSSQQTLDTIALDVTTITGINTVTNVREVIFPTGMKQADYAGTVKDTLDLRSDTATVRCGIKDLGTCQFMYNSSYEYFETTSVIIGEINDRAANFIINSPYFNDGYNSTSSTMSNAPNYACYKRLQNGRLFLKNTNYSDPTAFKTAMNGIEIIYELATPITYTDLQDGNGNPLNPRYKVEQGGTEQVLPVNTSTPTTVAPTLSTIYNKNI